MKFYIEVGALDDSGQAIDARRRIIEEHCLNQKMGHMVLQGVVYELWRDLKRNEH